MKRRRQKQELKKFNSIVAQIPRDENYNLIMRLFDDAFYLIDKKGRKVFDKRIGVRVAEIDDMVKNNSTIEYLKSLGIVDVCEKSYEDANRIERGIIIFKRDLLKN